jgi:hypothetical protein
MRNAVAGLDDRQLDTPYRPGGWTVRQVVHHVADSHMNALIRMKLALTEDAPTIKPYDENAWAVLGDARMPIDVSLAIIDGLHRRWDVLNQALQEPDYERLWTHPEHGKTFHDRLAAAELRLALAAPHGARHGAARASELVGRPEGLPPWADLIGPQPRSGRIRPPPWPTTNRPSATLSA